MTDDPRPPDALTTAGHEQTYLTAYQGAAAGVLQVKMAEGRAASIVVLLQGLPIPAGRADTYREAATLAWALVALLQQIANDQVAASNAEMRPEQLP